MNFNGPTPHNLQQSSCKAHRLPDTSNTLEPDFSYTPSVSNSLSEDVALLSVPVGLSDLQSFFSVAVRDIEVVVGVIEEAAEAKETVRELDEVASVGYAQRAF